MEIMNEILLFFKDSHPFLYVVGSTTMGAVAMFIWIKKQWQESKAKEISSLAENGLLQRMQESNIQVSAENTRLTNEKIKYSQMLDIATEEIRKLHTEKHEYIVELDKLNRTITTNNDLIERLTEKINELKGNIINTDSENKQLPEIPPERLYRP